jgi:hypothetical protein
VQVLLAHLVLRGRQVRHQPHHVRQPVVSGGRAVRVGTPTVLPGQGRQFGDHHVAQVLWHLAAETEQQPDGGPGTAGDKTE